MPKKPQQQAESNSHVLSREDRKNEQISRMIEKAEKQRLKREEKKKLAVLNKTQVNNKAGRKKKIPQLGPKRTQVAIHILFSEKALQQSAANRFFFERKQTIEEKQRLEQEEMWQRYAFRIQQQQVQASLNASQPKQSLPKHQHPFVGQQQSQSAAVTASLNGVAPQTHGVPAVEQHNLMHYLNAGETGGNYVQHLEDQSNSSQLSSASKSLVQQTPQPQTMLMQQTISTPATCVTSQPPSGSIVVQKAQPLLLPTGQNSLTKSISLGSVLNNLQQKHSSIVSSEEECKDPAAASAMMYSSVPAQQRHQAEDRKAGVTIKVNLIDRKDLNPQQHYGPEGDSKVVTTPPQQQQHPPETESLSEEQMILELTRQKMMEVSGKPAGTD